MCLQAEARARPKSKAERQAEAEAAREEALSTALPETNKGFKMMAKFGFKQGDTLGKSENARKVPIQVEVKPDRSGIGLESEKKRKMKEKWDEAERLVKRSKEEEGDYLEMRRQEEKDKRLERELDKAQKTAELLTARKAEDNGEPDRLDIPVKDVNVLWRSRVRRRAVIIHEKKQRQELNDAIGSRLPTLVADEDEDDDSKIAQGRDLAPFYTTLEEELEVEDSELADFENLPIAERLEKLLTYLRATFNYCLFCGYQYPDAEMEGCPGVTEEDHD